jgi:hypothetical protein
MGEDLKVVWAVYNNDLTLITCMKHSLLSLKLFTLALNSLDTLSDI